MTASGARGRLQSLVRAATTTATVVDSTHHGGNAIRTLSAYPDCSLLARRHLRCDDGPRLGSGWRLGAASTWAGSGMEARGLRGYAQEAQAQEKREDPEDQDDQEVRENLAIRAREARGDSGSRAQESAQGHEQTSPGGHILTPLEEYDARVRSGRLRDDEHQRGIIQDLEDLSRMLARYEQPAVHAPRMDDDSYDQHSQKSLFSFFSFFASKPARPVLPPISMALPKGLYMYGDVGSGKTMLMDLFYDTLPANIRNKTRIHFHAFMQSVHKDLHKIKMQHGDHVDAILFVAAAIAQRSSVLCFDEFQCTDVADAMILRRLIEALMAYGTVVVTTSNRHPDDLYKNGIQRESFIPAINLLKARLKVLNLDSQTDYRKIPRPPSGVYHHPLDRAAHTHAERWFRFLGDPANDPPHRAVHLVWGREIEVPRASGRCACFSFNEIIGRATGAADYLELMRNYDAFIITDVPGMDHKSRDLARRFITFIDAIYESRAKLVLTSAVPLTSLFLSENELHEAMTASSTTQTPDEHTDVSDVMRNLMDDLGMSMSMLKNSNMFSGDEERFAFARALSRLSEMGSKEWVERGMGLESSGGKKEMEGWQRVKSRWREDSM